MPDGSLLMRSLGALRAIAAVSGLYDLTLGLLFLVAVDRLAGWFSVPLPSPPVLGDTNGLFLTCVGLGYYLPFRDPDTYRAYLWLMGPLLKGAGAVVFIRDYLIRESPASYLLFAASDGVLAIVTLGLLLASRRGGRYSAAE